ncbi:MAG TPA: hypothetical protein VFA26_10540 [Gemmataceae bacterium]|nr:hypothetical protein [Gemmataceae bacterium]
MTPKEELEETARRVEKIEKALGAMAEGLRQSKERLKGSSSPPTTMSTPKDVNQGPHAYPGLG